LEVTRKQITSVGIDIGTTTTHLVFSRLTLENDPFAVSRKLRVAEREVIYQSKIYFTPLKNENTEIDVNEILPILLNEYEKAGIGLNEIDSGAVIITGESSRKINAEEIINIISGESGKFVAATAGPNFESVISAHGSGAVGYSDRNKVKLIHSDIGGGTSKIIVIEEGEIVHTLSVNIGGRQIAYDNEHKIIRLEKSAKLFLGELGKDLSVGDKVSVETLDQMAQLMAETLLGIIMGVNESPLQDRIIEGSLLDLKGTQYLYSFSGGVSEFIYGDNNSQYNDLGNLLGHKLLGMIKVQGLEIVELPEKIRATVIGASSFTLQISGYTTYTSTKIQLPMRNIPVVKPIIDKRNISPEYVSSQVKKALTRLDVDEGSRPIALAFHDPVRTNYTQLKDFVEGIKRALPNTTMKGTPLVLIFDTDIANSVGNVMIRETGIENILSIDEIELKEGDFIDVGEPMTDESIYPIVIKSLIFSG
jgi:ethanolamine utilization protein EutA